MSLANEAIHAAGRRGVAAARDDFPIFKRTVHGDHPLTFLDSAASSQRPECVIDAMSDFYRRHYANVHRGIHTLSEEATDAYESARQTIATWINAASSREIIFTAGTTAAINLVAKTWGDANLKSGDVIVLPISEHHANVVPWHQLASLRGCRLEFVPLNENETIDPAAIRETLHRTGAKLLTFSAASNVLGNHVDVTQWASLAHEFGARVLVDAAQAAPHQAIDVRAWQADFVVFSGHKMCGPSGIGVLYSPEAMLDAMPPWMGGGGMIATVTTDGFESAALPDKFEAGTPPITEAVGLAAAAKYLSSLGMDEIAAHERSLAAAAYDGLSQIDGLRILGPPPNAATSDDTTGDSHVRTGIVSFTMDRPHAHDVAQLLDTDGVAVRAGHHCTMPLHDAMGISASSRASFYLYNNNEDVDRLVESVRKIHERFSGPRRRRRTRSKQTS